MRRKSSLRPNCDVDFSKYFLALIAGFLFVVLYADSAFGQDLLVVPRRLVFDGVKRRSQELNLANTGTDTARYEISVIEVRMKENGTFEEIKNADSGNFASKYMRVFPRYVMLGPNESQTIKVQLTHLNQINEGEYRSHIYIRALPKKKDSRKPKLRKMVTNLRVKLVPMFGISIPTIIKVGESNTRVDLTDLKFKVSKGKAVFSLTVNRIGNMSAYGNISVEFISSSGNSIHVATVKGLSIYAPNAKRTIKLALNDKLGIRYREGKLRVIFSTQVEDRQVKMAESELNLTQSMDLE